MTDLLLQPALCKHYTSITVHLIALLLTALPYTELSMCVCAHMSCLLGGKNTSMLHRGGEGNTEAHIDRVGGLHTCTLRYSGPMAES